MKLSPKKSLGQHFLNNSIIAKKIVENIDTSIGNKLIEIGPGTGALTKLLIQRKELVIKLIEIDKEAIPILNKKFPELEIIHHDFLQFNLKKINWKNYMIVGNFPYNISSQILFKILENRDAIKQVTGMFQKEFADRICSNPKSKKYGIPSVLLQAFFNCNHLFDVEPNNFVPAPRVMSSVIQLTRNNTSDLGCDYNLFIKVVKTAFSQRRKKLKNALKKISNLEEINENQHLLSKRAEELNVFDFINLTNSIFTNSK